MSAEDYVKQTLALPDDFLVECIISLGYPDEDKRPVDFADLDWDKAVTWGMH